MGQAKNRGSFEERQALALKKREEAEALAEEKRRHFVEVAPNKAELQLIGLLAGLGLQARRMKLK